jgi:Fe-S-cluster containining protein
MDYNKRELLQLARGELAFLQRNPHSHQADEIRRLARDIAFILKYFRRISRKKAIEINGLLDGTGFDGRAFYRCILLADNGLCREHSQRPFVCIGYPWYYGTPHEDALFVSPCGYERDERLKTASAATPEPKG